MGTTGDARVSGGGAGGWDRAAGVCHALADPDRLALLRQLARGPTGARSLAAALGLPAAATARHLRLLTRHGLVGRRGRGRDAAYGLAKAVGTPPGTSFAFADGGTSIIVTPTLEPCPTPAAAAAAGPGATPSDELIRWARRVRRESAEAVGRSRALADVVATTLARSARVWEGVRLPAAGSRR